MDLFTSLAAIRFPGIDPIIFHVGPLAIRWYGVAYVVGFVLSYLMLRRASRIGALRLSVDSLDGLLAWIVVGVVAGGRGGWWLFYHRGGIEAWYEPFALWNGGMSFHGGLIGVAAAVVIWSWRHNAPLWNVADYLALVAPVGLLLGRIANFVNAELVGRATDVPWGVVFPGDSFARHPSQLYEALGEGILIGVTLWGVRRRGLPEGRLFALFLVLYAATRFLVEFTREPDTQVGFVAFGWLTMGQLLSVCMIGVGLCTWCLNRRIAEVGHGTGTQDEPHQVRGD